MSTPDYAKYHALIDHPTSTDEQKDEFIDAWWKIANRLIDAIYEGTFPDQPPTIV